LGAARRVPEESRADEKPPQPEPQNEISQAGAGGVSNRLSSRIDANHGWGPLQIRGLKAVPRHRMVLILSPAGRPLETESGASLTHRKTQSKNTWLSFSLPFLYRNRFCGLVKSTQISLSSPERGRGIHHQERE
jgi:hypothetical protein